ncbi:MAG: response regulator [Myxococcota bacterium]|jgi:DNA-binding NtrC family response regulator|nr:response regulator [Myxococcota bacterium]
MANTDIEQLLDQALAGTPSELEAPRPEILIVDDDKNVGEALRLVLGDTYTVTFALTGDEGVASLHKGTRAVVLDVRMRVKDGFDTFIELKKKQPDVPIIFHSAYQDVRDPYEVMNEFRPFGYIKKGDDEVLRQTIAKAVESYQQMLDVEELTRKLEEENTRLAVLKSEREQELATLTEELVVRRSNEPGPAAEGDD